MSLQKVQNLELGEQNPLNLMITEAWPSSDLDFFAVRSQFKLALKLQFANEKN